MTQIPIFRDVWGLGPQNAGYPGAFPRGLIPKIKRRWWGTKRLWLFSGSHKDSTGITVDIKQELQPDVAANCELLPFTDESFDFVMLDPPYSEEEARKMYDLSYYSLLKVMNEAARVCAPGGHVLLLHRTIPFIHPKETSHKKRLHLAGVVGVYTIAGWTNMRALTIWRKREVLDVSLQ